MRKRKGQTTVEFAVIILLLLMMVLGLMQLLIFGITYGLAARKAMNIEQQTAMQSVPSSLLGKQFTITVTDAVPQVASFIPLPKSVSVPKVGRYLN